MQYAIQLMHDIWLWRLHPVLPPSLQCLDTAVQIAKSIIYLSSVCLVLGIPH